MGVCHVIKLKWNSLFVFVVFRFSMIVEKGVVTKVNVEPEAGGLSCSLAPELLKYL